MEPMLNIALSAARQASRLIEQAADETDLVTIETKGLHDFVKEVDKTAEALITEAIHKAHPTHGILSEKNGRTEGKGEGKDYEWIINPLEGSTNFIHGMPHFSVSLAVKIKGQVEHAVIIDPMRQEEFTASRGRGAQLNGKRLRISKQVGLDGALLGTGFPFRPDQDSYFINFMSMFASFAKQTPHIRSQGSTSLNLAYVAAGRFDGLWEMGLQEWNMAAGILLIKEAGGLVGDIKGGHKHIETGSIVCANPKLFKSMLQTIRPHLPKAKTKETPANETQDNESQNKEA